MYHAVAHRISELGDFWIEAKRAKTRSFYLIKGSKPNSYEFYRFNGILGEETKLWQFSEWIDGT